MTEQNGDCNCAGDGQGRGATGDSGHKIRAACLRKRLPKQASPRLSRVGEAHLLPRKRRLNLMFQVVHLATLLSKSGPEPVARSVDAALSRADGDAERERHFVERQIEIEMEKERLAIAARQVGQRAVDVETLNRRIRRIGRG